MSYALIAHGQHNPFLATPLPEHMYYPVSKHCQEGIDLDYSTLILENKFIIDAAVYEDVLSLKKAHMLPMQKSMEKLYQENLLFIEDYSRFFTENRRRIMEITSIYLEDWMPWLKLAQDQWIVLKPELQQFQKLFGTKNMHRHNVCHIGIESWLVRSKQSNNSILRNKLLRLLEKKILIDEIEQADIKGMLEFVVAQIVMADLVSSSTHSPILDWDDSKGMYNKIYATRWSDCDNGIVLNDEVKKLFSVVIPELLPNNIEELVKFIKSNGAGPSLRNELIEMINIGETVSKEWMLGYLNELMKNNLINQKKSKRLQWAGTIAGLVPCLNWVGSAALTGANVLADELLFQNDARYKWYYVLQEATQNVGASTFDM